MKNIEKNPVGRPKGQIRRYQKSFYVSIEEEEKLTKYLKRLKNQYKLKEPEK